MEGIVAFSIIFASICYFIEFCLEEGNIFGFWSATIMEWPDWIAKPLGKCIICASFWISFVMGLYLYANFAMELWQIPIAAMASSGLLLIIKRVEGIFYE